MSYNPSQPDYLDTRLTNVSNAWKNADEDYIANQLFPTVIVNKKTFKIANYTKENLRVPSSSVRTGESKAKRVNYFRGDQQMGPLQEHALSDFVTFEDQTMTDDPYDALSDATENLMDKMELIDEKALASFLSSTTNISQNTNIGLTPTNQWNDYGNSNPFNDIKTGCILMKSTALKIPNTFFTSWEAWIQMVDHPDFLDRIKWSQTGVMTESDFLKLFTPYGISKIVIGKVSENTAKEGQTDTLAPVWGKNAWLGYVTDKPGLREVNGGYKFQLDNARMTTNEAHSNPRGNEIVNYDYYDYELINSTLWYLMQNVVA
jgi:hypothetical protein